MSPHLLFLRSLGVILPEHLIEERVERLPTPLLPTDSFMRLTSHGDSTLHIRHESTTDWKRLKRSCRGFVPPSFHAPEGSTQNEVYSPDGSLIMLFLELGGQEAAGAWGGER